MVPAVTEVCLPQRAHSQSLPRRKPGSMPWFAAARLCPRRKRGRQTLGPTRREQISDASRLIREAALELSQRVRKIGHLGPRGERMFTLCSIIGRRFSPPLIVVPDAQG